MVHRKNRRSWQTKSRFYCYYYLLILYCQKCFTLSSLFDRPTTHSSEPFSMPSVWGETRIQLPPWLEALQVSFLFIYLFYFISFYFIFFLSLFECDFGLVFLSFLYYIYWFSYLCLCISQCSCLFIGQIIYLD